MHCKYLPVVPYKALEKFSKALYGTTGRYLQCMRFPSCHGLLGENAGRVYIFVYFFSLYNLRVNKLNGGTECLVVYLLVFAHFLFFS